jgi:hypothetical protein
MLPALDMLGIDDFMKTGMQETPRGRILATALPDAIAVKIRGRSRVSVRNVRDLHIYMAVVDHLCNEHHHYEGR